MDSKNLRAEVGTFQVLVRRDLNGSAYVLRLSRNDLAFVPGQHIHLGLAASSDLREYSIYSGIDDDFLEVLIREIDDGLVSRQLRRIVPTEHVRLEGPYGYFVLPDDRTVDERFLFVATGTGIAPFRSFVRSEPGLNYLLLHGISSGDDQFEYEYHHGVTTCLSRSSPEAKGSSNVVKQTEQRWHQGRVTSYLRDHPVDPTTRCYLCGNCDMIYEAFDILRAYGVPSSNLYAEVYF